MFIFKQKLLITVTSMPQNHEVKGKYFQKILFLETVK